MLGEFTERYNELFLKHLLCQLSLLLENLHLLWLVKHYHSKKNLNSSTELPKQKKFKLSSYISVKWWELLIIHLHISTVFLRVQLQEGYSRLLLILGFKLLSPLKTNILNNKGSSGSLQICAVSGLSSF